MTAVLYDDVVSTSPATKLTLASPPKRASKRAPRPPIAAGGDPMVDAAARVLCVPLRHVYAVLWRAGVIEITS